MHILYVHQNFPAQFGHIASHLVQNLGWQCTFVSETPSGQSGGIQKIQYKLRGGATQNNHFCTRTFENCVWHCDAVFEALRARPDVKPDLIVGHSGFGSTLFLRELYPQTPILNFFEYYYRPHDPDSDMEFRHDLGWTTPEMKFLRSRARNAMILLDLQNCQLGYTPTRFQKSRLPAEYDAKVRVIFDGVDRSLYHGYAETLRPAPETRGVRRLAGIDVPPGTRVVTYVSRGFESMRGFDVFMRAAKRIYSQYPDVLFLVIGTDRVAYGGDEGYTGGKSFKDWVLAQDAYDLQRIRFVGRLPQDELGRVLASSDLHIYLTVPFVLSWSMMDALSCGAVVLGSDTTPVREMIRDGENGLLADFFDPDAFAEKALAVLRDPAAYRPLGRAAEQMIVERYSLDAVLPEMLRLYEDTMQVRSGLEPPRERPADPVPPAPQATTPPHPPASTRPADKPIGPPRSGGDVLMGRVKGKGPLPFRK
jgi:glycosyltransferase involved in cell wall biosynthesis